MAIRQSLQSPAVGRPPQGTAQPKTPRGRKSFRPKATASTSATSDRVAALEKQLEIQQRALDTQAWMVKEISDLRQQLAKESALGSRDDIALRTEIAALRQENAALQRKADCLNQMTSLFNGAAGTVGEELVTVSDQRSRKFDIPDASDLVNCSFHGFLWKVVAESDLNRTYKSCWPIVLKIEEWNQKNPTKMAKISQTMLNKSGVNFSRAKGFVDAYAIELQQYHDQIGLTKANSGKFNEVYEFIRTALGKGRRGYI